MTASEIIRREVLLKELAEAAEITDYEYRWQARDRAFLKYIDDAEVAAAFEKAHRTYGH